MVTGYEWLACRTGQLANGRLSRCSRPAAVPCLSVLHQQQRPRRARMMCPASVQKRYPCIQLGNSYKMAPRSGKSTHNSEQRSDFKREIIHLMGGDLGLCANSSSSRFCGSFSPFTD
ncbi:hypothetical protein JZ751_014210, partial [Albula glossodonta]